MGGMRLASKKMKGLFLQVLKRLLFTRSAPDARLDFHPLPATGKVQGKGQRTISRGRSAFAPSAIGKAPHPLECSHASAVQRVSANNNPSHLVPNDASQPPQTPYAT